MRAGCCGRDEITGSAGAGRGSERGENLGRGCGRWGCGGGEGKRKEHPRQKAHPSPQQVGRNCQVANGVADGG